MTKKLPSEWDRAHGKKTRIHLHMPDSLLEFMEKWIQRGRYADRAIMIRQACWDLIERLEQVPEETQETEEEEEPMDPTPSEPTIGDLLKVYQILQEDAPL